MANGFRMEENMSSPLSLYFYRGAENMMLTLMAGVTTVRDAGLADIGAKIAVEKSKIVGPRLFISVMPLSISGGHFDFHLNSGFDMRISYPGLPLSVCDGPGEVRKRVREVLRAEADVIKVMVTGGVISANDAPEHPQFTIEELEIIVEEANYQNKTVMAHAHGAEGIKNALKSGVKSIEHGTYLDDEGIDLILEKEAYLSPTLMAIEYLKESGENNSLPSFSTDKAAQIVETRTKNLKKAFEAGISIVMGTDSGVHPHGKNLHELELLCDMGMDPMDAILAGTLHAAECIGVEEDLGSLEAGKLADVVISRVNPLNSIGGLGDPNNIVMVMKDGVIYKNTITR
jgi:imidazolonepropionase-like amidohydrolase